MKQESDCISVETQNVYKPRTTVKTSDKMNAAKVMIGEAHSECQPTHYVVLLVGATGAGKSTLINGIINHIFGVQWEDDFRFKLIPEEAGAKRTHSQTQCITAYTFHKREGSPFPYCLTIIDTPGFGDAEGIERDKNLVAEITKFLSTPGPEGMNYIHAIGFVTHAPSTRLSATQKYIYDSLQSAFGQSISRNILMLTTFADSKTPPVLEAARKAGITVRKSFKFNNSALFPMPEHTMQDDTKDFDRLFWELSKNSYNKFFDYLMRMEMCSLQERMRVLGQKNAIQVGLKTQVQLMGIKIEQLEQEEKLLKLIKERMTEDGKDLNWLIEVPTMLLVAAGGEDFAINCSKCQFSCYYNSPFPDNSVTCAVCPRKCAKDQHHHSAYTRIPGVVRVATTYETLKNRYNLKARDDEGDEVDSLTTSLRMETIELYKQVFQFLWDAQKDIQELEKPVSSQSPFSVLDYIDSVIQEGDTATPAQLISMKHLQTIRKAADFMAGLGEESAFQTEAEEVARKLANASDTANGVAFAVNKKWWLEWH